MISTKYGSKQKTDKIAINIHIPRDIYKEMICAAIDSDENFLDMFISAFNEIFLGNRRCSVEVSQRRRKWIEREVRV